MLQTKNLLERLQWNHTNQLVALAIDGGASMIGCHCGLMTGWDMMFPLWSTLIALHIEKVCLQWRIQNNTIVVVFEPILDEFINEVYEWVRRSSNRWKILKSWMNKFDLHPLAILQFHSIRWLSWGQVLEWILYDMLVILDAFKWRRPISTIKL